MAVPWLLAEPPGEAAAWQRQAGLQGAAAALKGARQRTLAALPLPGGAAYPESMPVLPGGLAGAWDRISSGFP